MWQPLGDSDTNRYAKPICIFHSLYYLFQKKVFLVDPVSIAAIDGTTVEFTCTANNATLVVYYVNETIASNKNIRSIGFDQNFEKELNETQRQRNLTVTVSSQYNNTEIYCKAYGMPNSNSTIAKLTVQGL